ncbi:MAG: 4-hydroxythreonine-4-phosphate dehydrogenase PdxA [bacterium]
MIPIIAVTTGDPLGIGPEITLKALRDEKVRKACRTVVIGEETSLFKSSPHLLRQGAGMAFLPVYCEEKPRFSGPRGPDRAAGMASLRAVRLALRLALEKRVDAVVTAPVCKESWTLAGAGFTGHTGLLKAMSGRRNAAMLFVSGNIRAALVTEHLPVKNLPSALTKGKTAAVCRTFCSALRLLGIDRPRLALCSLNPHAGEGGILGKEEIRVLTPAVSRLRKGGLKIEGPLSPDAVWSGHLKGRWDGVVGIYHDQVLVPVKLIAKNPVVHWTHGLGFIRTSPAHGTAFDIAGKNKADPSSMIEAMLFAARLVRKQQEARSQRQEARGKKQEVRIQKSGERQNNT